eukprot:TRINITY_DN6520_c0_g1_i2.p1 TRINITY_DN6520_c0_g1~~TRINITY_DN6520_c0_g1_i2.p1  ORF type:complete len:186 (-),score=50.78 TRINITY_DN6520_c0_g1_i2:112-627(-)
MPQQAIKTSPYFKSNPSSTITSKIKRNESSPLESRDVKKLKKEEIYFPKTREEREKFVNPRTNRVMTPFQWKVYDLILNIPKGKVTTYASVASSLQSSPRATGGALRNNPFAPCVPCHRVIASDGYIGGFYGKWGIEAKNGQDKKELLESEGVEFDERGFLKDENHKVQMN